eukprot:2566101-Rhodomonas_salina.1
MFHHGLAQPIRVPVTSGASFYLSTTATSSTVRTTVTSFFLSLSTRPVQPHDRGRELNNNRSRLRNLILTGCWTTSVEVWGGSMEVLVEDYKCGVGARRCSRRTRDRGRAKAVQLDASRSTWAHLQRLLRTKVCTLCHSASGHDASEVGCVRAHHASSPPPLFMTPLAR